MNCCLTPAPVKRPHGRGPPQSYLFERAGGDYAILFVVGAVAAALAIDLATALTMGRESTHRFRVL
jgi:hypothetical protein